MTTLRGPLARLDRSRDELAKAWLVRVIERASLDEIRELPTEQIARELPELITDIVRAASDGGNGRDPYALSEEQASRAAALAALRGSTSDGAAADIARDVASLQRVLVGALRDELANSDPEAFAEAVEQPGRRHRRGSGGGRRGAASGAGPASSSRRPTPTRSPGSATCARYSASLGGWWSSTSATGTRSPCSCSTSTG